MISQIQRAEQLTDHKIGRERRVGLRVGNEIGLNHLNPIRC